MRIPTDGIDPLTPDVASDHRSFFLRSVTGWKSSKNFHCGMVPANGPSSAA